MTTSNKTQITLPSDTQFRFTRTFNAPRQLVWEAYTECKHLKHWWGPTGWTLPTCEIDFRVGGTWFYCMAGPEDMTSCGKSFYDEIEKPSKIVLRDLFVDEDGNEMDGMPVATTTLEFVDNGPTTTVVSTTNYPSKEMRDQVIEMGMEAGIDQTLNRLDALLERVTQ